jgi:hypothetical protein
MKRAYLEANAISRAAEESLSGKQLRDILGRNGLVPAIGFHTIYELARTFLNDKKIEVARTLFQIVADLESEYCEESYEILCQELNHCLRQTQIKPFLDGGKQSDTVTEVAKFARGIFDDRARSFIESREKRFRADHPQISQNNIRAFAKDPPKNKVRTLEEFTAYYKNGQLEVVVQIFGGKLTLEQAEAVIASIERYPAMRAALMANMYLFFVQMTQKVPPATDKVDDHRHVIEASYCDAFITNDNQLLNNLGKINPRLKPVSWGALRQRV